MICSDETIHRYLLLLILIYYIISQSKDVVKRIYFNRVAKIVFPFLLILLKKVIK